MQVRTRRRWMDRVEGRRNHFWVGRGVRCEYATQTLTLCYCRSPGLRAPCIVVGSDERAHSSSVIERKEEQILLPDAPPSSRFVLVLVRSQLLVQAIRTRRANLSRDLKEQRNDELSAIRRRPLRQIASRAHAQAYCDADRLRLGLLRLRLAGHDETERFCDLV